MRELRIERGVSQEALAQDLGVSRQSVVWWETGHCIPSARNLMKLAAYFGKTVEEMMEVFTDERR